MVRVHAFVHGVVQGVGYRTWAQRKAQALAVFGWVKNREDGSVESVLEGEDSAVSEMIEALHTGPSYARVEKVEVQWGEYTGDFAGFEVRG